MYVVTVEFLLNCMRGNENRQHTGPEKEVLGHVFFLVTPLKVFKLREIKRFKNRLRNQGHIRIICNCFSIDLSSSPHFVKEKYLVADKV